MQHYDHGGDIYANPEVTLDFSVSVNPLGMPEEVRHAIIAHVDDYVHYPDPFCRRLRQAIAAHEGVEEEAVLCGNGAADLIYRLCLALAPRKALVCAPTFSEYERALEHVGCEVAHHDLRLEDDFQLTDALCDSLVPGIDVLFLCNPNNPTGLLAPEGVLQGILERAALNGTRVVVDECFLDFTTGASVKGFLERMPGLVVLKAFTKSYAMAGLRLGYLLTSDQELLESVSDAAQCWSVSVPAQVAGIAALTCEGWMEKTRRFVAQERSFLSEGLTALGLKVFPSDANYLLVRSEASLYEPLLEKGILIRSCANFKGLDATYCRIGVKAHDQNVRLLEALRLC